MVIRNLPKTKYVIILTSFTNSLDSQKVVRSFLDPVGCA